MTSQISQVAKATNCSQIPGPPQIVETTSAPEATAQTAPTNPTIAVHLGTTALATNAPTESAASVTPKPLPDMANAAVWRSQISWS